MKCDEFISKYEAGSALSRLRARLHVTRCAKCAATRDWLNQLRGELSVPVELTPYHRRVWENAAADEAPAPLRQWLTHRRLAAAGSLAIAAAVVVAVMMSLPQRDPSPEGNIVRGGGASSMVVTVPLQVSALEIAELETGLNKLEADLKGLAEDAARLEALQAISDLAATYQPLVADDAT